MICVYIEMTNTVFCGKIRATFLSFSEEKKAKSGGRSDDVAHVAF